MKPAGSNKTSPLSFFACCVYMYNYVCMYLQVPAQVKTFTQTNLRCKRSERCYTRRSKKVQVIMCRCIVRVTGAGAGAVVSQAPGTVLKSLSLFIRWPSKAEALQCLCLCSSDQHTSPRSLFFLLVLLYMCESFPQSKFHRAGVLWKIYVDTKTEFIRLNAVCWSL